MKSLFFHAFGISVIATSIIGAPLASGQSANSNKVKSVSQKSNSRAVNKYRSQVKNGQPMGYKRSNRTQVKTNQPMGFKKSK